MAVPARRLPSAPPDAPESRTLESVGRLAAGLTHELSTPIQYVGGNVQFLHSICQPLAALLALCHPALAALESSSADPALVARFKAAIETTDIDYLRREMPRALEESLEGIDRAGKILRAVNAFAHPGQKEKVAVDLNHAIETTITVAQYEWRNVADVVTSCARNLPLVTCHVDEINQVVLNLLLNAIQAVREKNAGTTVRGRITVGTRRAGRYAEVWIQDTGTGIPEAVLPHIFEPFFTTKAVGQGTGQGLSHARTVIVERHGGDIGVDSRPHGTTFTVRLPIDT
jgi:signal transduction histidine kinase